MGFVIVAAVFILLAVVAAVAGALSPKTYTVKSGYDRVGTEKPTYAGVIGGVTAVVLVIVAALFFLPPGIHDTPSRSVDVPITFGKAGSPLTPGFHWLMPWTSTENISTKVQTDNYNQDSNIQNYTGTCITVRLADGQEGCADVSISYQVKDSAGTQLYLDYGSGGNVMSQIQSTLVYRSVRDGLNNTLQNYNPITDALQSQSSGTSQFSEFDPQVVSYLNKNIGNYVGIVSFDLNYVHFSSEVQSQLDGIQTKQGQLQQEKEQLLINQATAAANQALVSKTGNLSSAQLQQECLTIIQKAEADNYPLPATFGNCVTSSSGSVIVNSK